MVATQSEKELKLMRKGTRACRECRRRKIKCLYDSDDPSPDSICQECKEHDRQCTKQGIVRGSDKSSRGVRVQVARLESAVQRIARDREQGSPTSLTVGQSGNGYRGVADLTAMQKSLNTRSPLFTLFNNDLFRRQDTNEIDSVEVSKSIAFSDPDLSDKAKLLSTISAIPTIYDVLKSAGEWWISWRDQHFALRKAAANMTLSKFVQLKIADDDPVCVSVGLMALAMALQHLRPGLDDHEVSLPLPPQTLMENITAAIDQVVLDTANYMNNPEVVLLFMLRAKFHVEHNQLRKGWLRVRQGIQAIQLMNLGAPLPEGVEITPDAAETQRFVGGIYEIDRLMSMVLGFPFATSEGFTDRRAYGLLFSAGTDEQQKMRALRRIVAVTAGHVNDRNAIDDLSAETTDKIQNALQMASVCMPTGWWDQLNQPIVGSAHFRHESLMTQMWYWTVQTYLHMPFLTGNEESAHSESSKQLCMDGARNTIRVFNYLRTEPAVSVYMCNCDDFQGLLGAVTLLIGLIQDAAKTTDGSLDPYNCMLKYESIEADMMLIDEIKEIFMYRSQQQGGSLSKQGLTVLAGLTSFLFEDEGEGDAFELPTNRQKTIMLPYFGTITVELTRKLPRLGTLCGRQCSLPGQTKLLTPPSSIDDSGSARSSGGFPSSNSAWWESGQSQFPENNATPASFGGPVGVGFDNDFGAGTATIGWNHWDHFMQDNELSQDWNPEWNEVLGEGFQSDYFGQLDITS